MTMAAAEEAQGSVVAVEAPVVQLTEAAAAGPAAGAAAAYLA